MEKDAIKMGGLLMAALLLLVTVRLDAQVRNDQLKKEIMIDRAGLRVDSFLNLLSKKTGLGFSFNSKKISPGKAVSLKPGRYSIAHCLAELQRLTGIHYAVMNNHIILVDNPPQEKYRLTLSEKKVVPVVKKKPVHKVVVKPVAPVVKKDSLVMPVPVMMAIDSIPKKDSIPIKDSLPKLLNVSTDKSFGLPGLFNAKIKDTVRIDTTKKKTVKTKERDSYKPTRRLRDYDPYAKDWNDQPTVSVGISALRPDIYNLFGVGVSILYENPFGRKWSWTAAAGYHQIFGKLDTTVMSQDTIPHLKDSSLNKNFAQIPISIGLRYYVARPLYAAFEAGYTIKASKEVGSFISFAPSLGLQFPVGDNAIDINVRYLYMMGQPTFEKPRLQKGDFGFWTLRVGYVF